MMKRIFVLLCALVLCIPALCVSDTTYYCDNCDYAGSFVEVVLGEEVIDGAPGQWYATVCPSCGTPSPAIPPSWRQTGPAVADPSPQTVNTNPEPPKTEPKQEIKEENKAPAPQKGENNPPAQTGNSEQPVTVQPEEDTKTQETGDAIAPEAPAERPPAQQESPAGSGGTENVVQVVPKQPAVQTDTVQTAPVSGPGQTDSQPQAATDPLPPVPEENPATEQSAPQSGEASGTESGSDNPDTASQGGNTYVRKSRNLKKYPIFSASRPSRRLNQEGDPVAWAPIPGEKIYPVAPEEGSSILRHMLDGD